MYIVTTLRQISCVSRYQTAESDSGVLWTLALPSVEGRAPACVGEHSDTAKHCRGDLLTEKEEKYTFLSKQQSSKIKEEESRYIV